MGTVVLMGWGKYCGNMGECAKGWRFVLVMNVWVTGQIIYWDLRGKKLVYIL